MENMIQATLLNDFIFCPISIYYHKLYAEMDNAVFQNVAQINGSYAHRKVDDNQYSTSKEIITSLDGYSEKYNIICRSLNDKMNSKRVLKE